MGTKILLAGAGQLGSRYLQGMARCSRELEIHVFDPLPASLERAASRWGEVAGENSPHRVSYIDTLARAPAEIDVAVVATTADVRSDVVEQIVRQSQVRHWILEKILAQDPAQMERIRQLVGAQSSAWVNTPMHLWGLYQKLRQRYSGTPPLSASFEGFRGLACNAIHYVDFVSRWNGAEVASVDTSGLEAGWYPAKRDGFYEVDGRLKLDFSDGSSLRMSSFRESPGYRVQLEVAGDTWQVSETDGYAQNDTGTRVTGLVEFQSQLTGPLLDGILDGRGSALPTLDQSIRQHDPLLRALLAHWNSSMPDLRTLLPVT